MFLKISYNFSKIVIWKWWFWDNWNLSNLINDLDWHPLTIFKKILPLTVAEDEEEVTEEYNEP